MFSTRIKIIFRGAALLTLLALQSMGAEEGPGTEFRDIRLSVPVRGTGGDFTGTDQGLLPPLEQVEQALRKDSIRPLLLIEAFRDDTDHYAPLWSTDGEHLSFIRADLDKKTSKVELLENLFSGQVKTLFQKEESYDYMHAWSPVPWAGGLNFCFASTRGPSQTMNVFLGGWTLSPFPITDSPKLKKHPALAVGPDGRTFLAFEQEGHLFWADVSHPKTMSVPVELAVGSYPVWASGGGRLVYVQQQTTSGGVTYSIHAVEPAGGADQVILAPQKMAVRNLAISPGGAQVAFYLAGTRQGQWDLYLVSTNGGTPNLLAKDIVVENNFDNVGPSWSPDGQKIFFFSMQNQEGVKAFEQSYYRLLYKGIQPGGKIAALDYNKTYTTAVGAAVNPNPAYPEVAFVASRGLAQSVFVLVLNHTEGP